MAAASAFKKEATAETPKDFIISFGQQGPPQMVDTKKKTKKSDPPNMESNSIFILWRSGHNFFIHKQKVIN